MHTIYGLYLADRLIYIGCTAFPKKRHRQHELKLPGQWDRMARLASSRNKLRALGIERRMIQMHQPPLNTYATVREPAVRMAIATRSAKTRSKRKPKPMPTKPNPIKRAERRAARDLIRKAIEAHGSKTAAAAALGTTRQSIDRKLSAR